jgi:hypothetical protein
LAAALGAGPASRTVPPFVSTSMRMALSSGSFARAEDTDSVIAASSVVDTAAVPKFFSFRRTLWTRTSCGRAGSAANACRRKALRTPIGHAIQGAQTELGDPSRDRSNWNYVADGYMQIFQLGKKFANGRYCI